MRDLSGTPTRVPRWGPRLSVIAAWLAMLIVASGYVAVADSQQDPSPAATAPDSPRAVLNRFCVPCHNEKLRTAGLALDAIDAANVNAATETWEKVVRKLRSRAMPPAGSRRPDEATYDAVASQLETDLDRLAAVRPNPGTLPAFRRLTRTEYRNAIRDLLELDDLPKAVDLASLLPADNSSTGFDNLADLLFVSTTQLEQYLSAAQKISRLAVGDPAIQIVDTYNMSGERSQDVPVEQLSLGTRGGLAIRTLLPLDGEYSVHIELSAAPREPEQLEVTVDGARVQLFTVSDKPDADQAARPVSSGDSASNRPQTASAAPPLELEPGAPIQIDSVVNRRFERDRQAEARRAAIAKGFDLVIPLKAGPRVIGVTFIRRSAGPSENLVLPRLRGKGLLPGVASVTVKGPQHPTGPGDTPSRRRIFVCHPGRGTSAAEDGRCAKEILATLARRAYRRSVTDADLQPLLAIYNTGRAEGGFDAGIQRALERERMLVSPQFLFRIERDPANAAPNSVYRLSDVELASRLSFFLWSSIPDDELLNLAVAGKLKDPVMLERQVRRMLADARSRTLSSNFAAQWLFLRDVEAKTPSPRFFPDFDLSLTQDFQRETELFLESVFTEDRNVLDLLRANYTFVNERLARHYGIPNVFGTNFRRVTYSDDSPRRGLLGHGSILLLTSYANRTSPVLRGKYVLSNILGAPPPPPPPNVPALVTEAGESGKRLSMRESMAQHRNNPVCATCHARMDPIGFALDNFDAVGQWRSVDESGTPIDASGVFPDGTRFEGVAGLRQLLLRRPEQFVSTLTENLLIYALGRSLTHDDAPTVRAIVRDADRSDYRFSSIVTAIVESTPFQMRRTGDN
jgi:mono/diheme cytochrome c family protein